MTKEEQALEAAALAAHRAGQTWGAFYAKHRHAMQQAEPVDRGRYHRLLRRLLALLVSGDDEVLPVDDGEPGWECDDAPVVDDSTTAAKCLLPLRALPGAQHRPANVGRHPR